MKITIGVVQKPFGIRGEVKIKPTTDFIEERFAVGNIVAMTLGNNIRQLEIETVRRHQGSVLVKFKGLDSLNDVEFFHRGVLEIDRDELHELDDDEFYFVDLVGCTVVVDGQTLGLVSEVMDLPAHPVLRVKTDEDDALIPFVERFIASVDLDAKEIVINNMEGLL